MTVGLPACNTDFSMVASLEILIFEDSEICKPTSSKLHKIPSLFNSQLADEVQECLWFAETNFAHVPVDELRNVSILLESEMLEGAQSQRSVWLAIQRRFPK